MVTDSTEHGSTGQGAVPDAVVEAIRGFAIPGQPMAVRAHRRGHIHSTFISTWQHERESRRYLHQQMNDSVFTDIGKLMHNIERVTAHLAAREAVAPRGVQALRLVPANDGGSWFATTNPAQAWRTYEFVENTESYDLCDTPGRAFEAAREFGAFQEDLSDLDPKVLHETIPEFFSTSHRYRQFDAVKGRAERPDRLRAASAELQFVEERRSMAARLDECLADGRFPQRVVHGDTKLNNVLFDQRTKKAVCIVDLDTCMPGWSLYDFGDLVRFTAARSVEDEPDLQRVGTDLELYRALVDGYREGVGDMLTSAELEHMPFAARLVTLTVGLRFLTDYLNGDQYFPAQHPDHNLQRARVQFKMVAEMEGRREDMRVVSR